MNFRKLQNILGTVVVIGALSTLLFEGKIEEWWQHRSLKSDHRAIIGRIETIQGAVKFRKPQSLTSINAVAGMNLHSDDSVVTEEGQSAVISFNSGLKVELEPHSVVVITDLGPEMIFLKGHVKILNEVPGITLPPEALNKEEVKTAESMPVLSEVERPVPSGSKSIPHPKKINEKITLPDAYITAIIRNQKTFLNRCYAQHLRLDPDTQGRIDTSLTIESDGTVSTARVIGSSIADPQLQQCVVGTLQRAKFKSFAGDPIIVTYPINFD